MRYLLLSLLLLPLVAEAQSTIGVRAGVNASTWSGDETNLTEGRLGFTGGLVGRYAITPTVGVQAEALYSQKGVREVVSDNTVSTYKLDAIDIPVLVRLGVPLSPFADAGAFVGPTFSIPVNAARDFADDRVSISDLDAKTTYGITAGVDFYSGPFGVDLRYTTGLSDAFGSELTSGGQLGRFEGVKNQVLSATLGYRFGG